MRVWVGLKHWVKGKIGDRGEWQVLGLGTPRIQSYVERRAQGEAEKESEGGPVTVVA